MKFLRASSNLEYLRDWQEGPEAPPKDSAPGEQNREGAGTWEEPPQGMNLDEFLLHQED